MTPDQESASLFCKMPQSKQINILSQLLNSTFGERKEPQIGKQVSMTVLQ